MKQIREKIEKRRISLGMTITEVAEKASVSREQYRNIVRKDGYNFTVNSLLNILSVLGLQLTVSATDTVFCTKCRVAFDNSNVCPECKSDKHLLTIDNYI